MSRRDEDRARLATRLARGLDEAEHAEALEALAPFDEVTALLERASERERSAELAAAREPAPGEEAALRALAEAPLAAATPESSGARPPSLRTIVLAGLAAAAAFAALVALGALGRFVQSPGDAGEVPGGLYVGSTTCRAVSPVGAVDAYAPFLFEAEVPEGGYAQVAVWGADDPVGAQPRLVSEELAEPSWWPTSDELAELPDAIRWQVRVYTWDRTQIDEASATARRSGR